MKKVIVLLSLAALAGCATAPKIPDVVKVPVPVGCKKVTIPPKPKLPIRSLTKSSTPAEVQKALVESIGVLMGDDAALRRKLAPYIKASGKQK
ncbi:MAG TPA: hypothetical protein VFM97_00545 [Gammaproteobacteria bacterium]|nr:hypothetical protein [Gammaproteobacteria bacterium]